VFIRVTVVLLLVMGLSGFQSPSQPAYRNTNLSVDERVNDLLKRMTLEEKVAQLTCLWPRGRDIPPDALKDGIGQIARQQEHKGPRESAEFANSVQKYLVENTRLGIPAIFHDEILHGHMAQGSTSFPQPIALASSWDPELINKIFTAAALETRSRGAQQVLGPNLDLGREPRWGRTEETYGEDPYLVSRMGVAVIKAIQGRGPTVDNEHVIGAERPHHLWYDDASIAAKVLTRLRQVRRFRTQVEAALHVGGERARQGMQVQLARGGQAALEQARNPT